MHTTGIKKISDNDLKKFGSMFGLGIATIFGLTIPWINEISFPDAYPLWPWVCLLIVTGLSVTFPRIINPLHLIWMKFGMIMGWVNTRVILFILFFFIFMPIGLMIRLFGGDLLSKRLDRNCGSYKIPSTPTKPENLEKPY